jgi:phospholipase C
VLNALTSDPEVWSKTALLITFDENDGFFDHVVGACPNVAGLNGQSTVALDDEMFDGTAGLANGSNGVPGPYGLGVRVPLLVVSPWSTGGFVCSETFDHTSLIRFVEQRLCVGEPNITPWRRAVCGDLTSAFDFASASDTVPPLPSVAAYKPTQTDPPPGTEPPPYHPAPPLVGSVPTQEPGVRPSRRLGYRFRVDFEADGTSLNLAVTDHGRLGVSPPGTIADGRRRALQLHDRCRRQARDHAGRPRDLRPQPPWPQRLLPPLRRLSRHDPGYRRACRRGRRHGQAQHDQQH